MKNIIIVIGVIVIGGIAIMLLSGGNDEVAVVDDETVTVETTPEETEVEVEPVPVETESTEPNIVEVAVDANDFNTLVAAVTAAGLTDVLQSEGPFTVFAPTDAAFEDLPEGTVDTLLQPENVSDLASVLTYHVVPSAVLSGELTDGMVVETVNGESLVIGVTEEGVTVNGASVVTADITASNGVIHVIDTVLLPPTE